MRLFSSAASLVALLSLASAATAQHFARDLASSDVHSSGLEARSTKTCRGSGEYPTPINGVCKPCSYKFSGASTCSTSAALKCKTGYLSSGKCVSSCPASTFASSGKCASCSSKFSGAATCTAAGATKCSTGYLTSAGKCAATCPTNYIGIASSKKCAACSTVNGAASCSKGKVATCDSGFYLNSAKTACVKCTNIDANAVTCTSGSVITSCQSPFSVASNKKTCHLGSTWSFYLSSTLPDIDYASDKSSAVLCGRNTVANSMPLATYDPDTNNCYESASLNSTVVSELVWDDDSSVFVYGSCATNNKLVPTDAKARCYDAIMTATACTLTDSSAACTTLLNDCDGDQFRNIDGLCQDCQAVYDDALTCDIYNGATTCIDGDYVNNGTCSGCTDFDANAATCETDGTVDSCNYGYTVATNGTACVVDTDMPASTQLQNAWSYYMDSFVGNLTQFVTDSVTDQFDCAEQVWSANLTMSAWDATSSTCYSATESDVLLAELAEYDGNSVIVMNTCSDNSASVSDDENDVCYDVSIDGDSCTLDDGSACS